MIDEVPLLLGDQALALLAQRLRPLLTDDPAATPRCDDQLMTCAQAAEVANVNVETVRRAIRNGALSTSARIGRSPRISQADLNVWLAATRAQSGARAQRPITTSKPSRTGLLEGSLRARWTGRAA